jgi:hypothetical protein
VCVLSGVLFFSFLPPPPLPPPSALVSCSTPTSTCRTCGARRRPGSPAPSARSTARTAGASTPSGTTSQTRTSSTTSSRRCPGEEQEGRRGESGTEEGDTAAASGTAHTRPGPHCTGTTPSRRLPTSARLSAATICATRHPSRRRCCGPRSTASSSRTRATLCSTSRSEAWPGCPGVRVVSDAIFCFSFTSYRFQKWGALGTRADSQAGRLPLAVPVGCAEQFTDSTSSLFERNLSYYHAPSLRIARASQSGVYR